MIRFLLLSAVLLLGACSNVIPTKASPPWRVCLENTEVIKCENENPTANLTIRGSL